MYESMGGWAGGPGDHWSPDGGRESYNSNIVAILITSIKRMFERGRGGEGRGGWGGSVAENDILVLIKQQ